MMGHFWIWVEVAASQQDGWHFVSEDDVLWPTAALEVLGDIPAGTQLVDFFVGPPEHHAAQFAHRPQAALGSTFVPIARGPYYDHDGRAGSATLGAQGYALTKAGAAYLLTEFLQEGSALEKGWWIPVDSFMWNLADAKREPESSTSKLQAKWVLHWTVHEVHGRSVIGHGVIDGVEPDGSWPRVLLLVLIGVGVGGFFLCAVFLSMRQVIGARELQSGVGADLVEGRVEQDRL